MDEGEAVLVCSIGVSLNSVCHKKTYTGNEELFSMVSMTAEEQYALKSRTGADDVLALLAELESS